MIFSDILKLSCFYFLNLSEKAFKIKPREVLFQFLFALSISIFYEYVALKLNKTNHYKYY